MKFIFDCDDLISVQRSEWRKHCIRASQPASSSHTTQLTHSKSATITSTLSHVASHHTFSTHQSHFPLPLPLPSHHHHPLLLLTFFTSHRTHLWRLHRCYLFASYSTNPLSTSGTLLASLFHPHFLIPPPHRPSSHLTFTSSAMAPLSSYREGMNTMYDNEPVRLVVSTQFLIKMGMAGFLVSEHPLPITTTLHVLQQMPTLAS